MAGTACAVLGAVCYGVTIVLGRTLATRGFSAQAALGFRFAIAGLALFAVLAVLRRPLLPAPGERVRVLMLGLIGYAAESTLFYMGLERGTAAAVALLFYSYPAMVTVAELAQSRRWPDPRLLTALALSAAGTALIIGTAGRVAITPMGVVLSLASAATFSIYLLVSTRAVSRTEALTTGAWVAFGAALALLTTGALGRQLEWPGGSWPQMLAYGASTGAAFALLFAALRRLGATRTSVAMTTEALAAVVLGAVVLNEPLSLLQGVGGASILAATVLIALSPIRRGVSVPVATGA